MSATKGEMAGRKKYWHPNECRKDLEIAKSKMQELMDEAKRLNEQADQFHATKHPELMEQAQWNREKAEGLVASANRIADGKIKKLTNALTALNTPTLFGPPEPVLLEDLD